MHFLPQTRHGISDFDCLSYYTSALAQMQLMQILASQQAVVSENDIDYFRVDSTPISFITFAFLSMIHFADVYDLLAVLSTVHFFFRMSSGCRSRPS